MSTWRREVCMLRKLEFTYESEVICLHLDSSRLLISGFAIAGGTKPSLPTPQRSIYSTSPLTRAGAGAAAPLLTISLWGTFSTIACSGALASCFLLIPLPPGVR